MTNLIIYCLEILNNSMSRMLCTNEIPIKVIDIYAPMHPILESNFSESELINTVRLYI